MPRVALVARRHRVAPPQFAIRPDRRRAVRRDQVPLLVDLPELRATREARLRAQQSIDDLPARRVDHDDPFVRLLHEQ